MIRVISVKQAAGYLKTHPSTIYRLLKAGRIPAFRIGSDWRLTEESLDEWVRSQESNSDSNKLAPDKGQESRP